MNESGATEESATNEPNSTDLKRSAVRLPRLRHASPWSSRVLLLVALLAALVLAPFWLGPFLLPEPPGVTPLPSTNTPLHTLPVGGATQGPGREIARDSFSRAVASGWGAAENGGEYAFTASPSLEVVDGKARVLADGSATSAILPAALGNDIDASLSFEIGEPSATDTASVALLLRHLADGSDYRATVELSPEGQPVLSLELSSAGVVRRIYGPIAVELPSEQGQPNGPIGSALRMRAVVTGSDPATISARVWLASQTEPSHWNARVIDWTGSLQASGSVGIGWSKTGAAAAPLAFSFDDLIAIDWEAGE